MSTSQRDPINDIRAQFAMLVRLHWHFFLAQGVIMIVLGVLAVIWPQLSTVAVDVYVGWLFLLSGVVGCITMFFAPGASAFFWSLFTAAFSLFVGVLLLWHPIEGVISLTLVLIAFFIAEGVFQIAASLSYRDAFPNSWGWMLASGIADLILAGLIVSGWPGTATWALGLIVGVNLISSGIAITMVAVTGRRLVRTVDKAFR